MASTALADPRMESGKLPEPATNLDKLQGTNRSAATLFRNAHIPTPAARSSVLRCRDWAPEAGVM
eukprot:NODE_7474_length_566_cov_4.959381_g6457_i0.p3 GENE.NODE_7474_length_566_cov_4.959381_g6457_i0~~NODE_7474_length_566_cov_4.959381_g6457_i0.p3  ORF type:complete len:65 (+),score=1.45 NODE_7474_length_566_cov_4.959381_g6457_i0:182-376(+)